MGVTVELGQTFKLVDEGMLEVDKVMEDTTKVEETVVFEYILEAICNNMNRLVTTSCGKGSYGTSLGQKHRLKLGKKS